ncbi:MAG: glycosyltransferase family 39 protein [Bacteroidetes bacterium]|nr:glycosyltransferase family 39 protein [Bacteroidota bacterium]
MKKNIEQIRPHHLLFGIVILGAFFRLYKIDYQSLWLDELYSIIPTAPENSIQSIIEHCKTDQPPFFFLFIHSVFRFFPYNEITGRIACAIIGLISIVVIYFLGSEIKNREAGLFASFLCAINFFHIFYSQELRFYSMAFLLSSVSYLFFIKACRNPKTRNLFLYAVSTVALLYTHYFGLLIFGAQGFTFIYLIIKDKNYQLARFGIITGLLVLLAFSPWIPTLIADSKVNSFWIKAPKIYFLAEYFYDYTGKDAATTIIFIFLIVLFFKNFTFNKSDSNSFIVLMLWMIISYAVPYLWSIARVPILHDRYTIVVLPAWFLLTSLGWEKLKSVPLKYTLTSALFVSLLINLTFFKKHYTRITKDQYRECSLFVINNNKQHYPIYAPDPLSWHFNYYFRNETNKVTSIDERKSSGNCWLLQSHFSVKERETSLKMLSNEYIILEKHTFFKAEAILMQHK